MAYSQARFGPDDVANFPPPPLWVTWTREDQWGRQQGDGKGPLRHHPDLKKCRQRVGRYVGNQWYGKTGCWTTDWKIFEWDHQAQKYVLRYSAKEGEPKSEHPLFRRKVAGEEKALATIRKAMMEMAR